MMKRNFYIITILFLALPTIMFAQYTDIINSNRPGGSQGAFAPGVKVLHFETGVSMGWEKHNLRLTETTAYEFDYTIRYGLLRDRLEINLQGSFLYEQVTDNRNPEVSFEFNQSNFRSNTLGAKYLLYDPYHKRDQRGPNLYSWRANNVFQWNELIPAISIYAGVNLDSNDNPFLPPDNPNFSPRVALITQHNFNGGFVFVTNLIADRFTTDYPTYSYILTLTHAFNKKFSMFVENQGIKSDFYADQLLRFGAAHLFGNDFQIDASALINFKDTPSRFFVGIGASYRIDNHPAKTPRRN